MANRECSPLAKRPRTASGSDESTQCCFADRVRLLVGIGRLLCFRLPSPGLLRSVRVRLMGLLDDLIVHTDDTDKIAGMRAEEIMYQEKKPVTFRVALAAVQEATQLLLDSHVVDESDDVYHILVYIAVVFQNVIGNVLSRQDTGIQTVDHFFASCQSKHGEDPKRVCGWSSEFAPWLEYKHLPAAAEGFEQYSIFAPKMALVTAPDVVGGLIYQKTDSCWYYGTLCHPDDVDTLRALSDHPDAVEIESISE